MALLHADGFELNSVTANLNTAVTMGTGQTVGTTHVRSGTYAGRVSGMSSTVACGWEFKWASSTSAGPFWMGTGLYVVTVPSATNHIISLNAASGSVGSTERAKITLENNGTLILRNAAGTQIGSASAAVNDSTYHYVELKSDASPASGSRVIEARLDGAVFATTSTETQGNSFAYSVGGNLDGEAQTAGEWWFDDTYATDNTGTSMTSYLGSSIKMIHMLPNAAGDANGFLVNVGGTAGAANNFTRVNEVTPDDATTYNASAVLNAEDLYNVAASGIGSSDTVNAVLVGGRFADTVAADITTAIKFEIIKTSGGTKSQSAAIVPNTTSWNTNGIAVPRLYPIILYKDPDGNAWTQTTLDSMQIGYLESTSNVQSIAVSTIWALVIYTPSTGSPSSSTSPSISPSSSASPSISPSASVSPSSSVSASTSPSISPSSSVSSSPSAAIPLDGREDDITATAQEGFLRIPKVAATNLSIVKGENTVIIEKPTIDDIIITEPPVTETIIAVEKEKHA